MNKIIYTTLAISSLLISGCGDKEAKTKEKNSKPSFMFWCFRKEIVSTEYQVPDMKTKKAASYIQGQLKRIPGFESSSHDLENHTVTVAYKSSTVRSMNFEEGIALSGFSVNGRPADPKAKIPEGVK